MYRLLPVLCFLCCEMAAFAEQLDYQVLDPELKVVRLDSSPDDSFLSVRLDTTGRIFVGGRKTLYVYDLDTSGKYQPRHLLFEFPDHSWVNDIEILGDDLYVVTVSAVYRLPGARGRRAPGSQPRSAARSRRAHAERAGGTGTGAEIASGCARRAFR